MRLHRHSLTCVHSCRHSRFSVHAADWPGQQHLLYLAFCQLFKPSDVQTPQSKRSLWMRCAQSVGMLRNITTFHTVATAAVERTAGGGGGDAGKITYNVIKARLADLLYKITSQKFEDPVEGEAAIKCASPAPVLPCLALSCPVHGQCQEMATFMLFLAGEETTRVRP